MKSRVYLLFFALSIPALLSGQANYGTIAGTVTDPHAAVIPKAAIQVLAEDRGQQYNATTIEGTPSAAFGQNDITATVAIFYQFGGRQSQKN